MAIAHVNSTSAKVRGTSLAVTVPTGGAVGDLLLFCVSNSSPDTWSVPSGLTVAYQIHNGGPSTALYYRVVQSGDPSSYTFTQPNTVNSTAVCIRYSGVDQTTPIRFWTASQSDNNTAQTSVTMPTVQNVGTSDMCVGFGVANSSSSNVTTLLSAPAGWTSRQSLTQNFFTQKSNATIGFDKAAAADTPAITGFSGFYIAFNVCLADAASPTSTIDRFPPVFQTSSTAAATSSSTSLSINAPSGVTDGDLLIACATSDFNNPLAITGSWTPLDQSTPSVDTTAITDNAAWLWFRIANSEPSSYMVSCSAAGVRCAAIVRYSVADPFAPIRFVQHTESTSTPTTSPAPPSLLAAQTGDLILNFYCTGSDSGTISSTSITPPGSGWITRANVGTAVASSFQTATAVVEKLSAADFPTASCANAGTWSVFSVALAGSPIVWRRALGPNYRR